MKHLLKKLLLFCISINTISLFAQVADASYMIANDREHNDSLESQIKTLVKEESLVSDNARELYKEATFIAISKTKYILAKFKILQESYNKFKLERNINKNLLATAEKNIIDIRKDIEQFNYLQAESKIIDTFSFIALTPVLSIKVSPQYFSPDGDGYNDIVTITPTQVVQANFPITENPISISSWKITVYKVGFSVNETNRNSPPEDIFVPIKVFSGNGSLPKSIKWNGKYDDDVNKVDSDSIYIIYLTAIDTKAGEAVSDSTMIKTGIFVNKTTRGNIIEISSVLFDFDKSDIKTAHIPILEEIYEKMLKYGDYSIAVEGHADYVGAATYNAELSQRRADAVKNYLSSIGFPEYKMSSFGYGESIPRSLDIKKSSINRRVTFMLFRNDKEKELYLKKSYEYDRKKETTMNVLK